MPPSDDKPGTVQIPADLTAADARRLVGDLRARLDGAAGPIRVELAGDDLSGEPSLSAVQLLISLRNTQAETAISLGDTAMAAIEAFGRPSTSGAST